MATINGSNGELLKRLDDLQTKVEKLEGTVSLTHNKALRSQSDPSGGRSPKAASQVWLLPRQVLVQAGELDTRSSNTVG